jgi:hypothetical protein
MFGTKKFPNVGYPTPSDIPNTTSCLLLQVPASVEWWALVVGVLYAPMFEWEWQQFEGNLTQADTVARWQVMFEDALALAETTNCAVSDLQTPFWDTAADVGDSAPVGTQTWYGEVVDPNAAPASLTWFENAAIWTFTGLLAVSGTPAAAILFNTLAPKFVLAQKAGAVGEVIRIVVDAQDIATVDTTGMSGQIIETTVLPDPAISPHQIYLIKVS